MLLSSLKPSQDEPANDDHAQWFLFCFYSFFHFAFSVFTFTCWFWLSLFSFYFHFLSSLSNPPKMSWLMMIMHSGSFFLFTFFTFSFCFHFPFLVLTLLFGFDFHFLVFTFISIMESYEHSILLLSNPPKMSPLMMIIHSGLLKSLAFISVIYSKSITVWFIIQPESLEEYKKNGHISLNLRTFSTMQQSAK